MRRTARLCARAALGVALGTTLLASARVARAQVSDEVRKEARERFDRGLRLFNQGDNGGALAEFQKAYELVHHPVVLYNVGLVLAAMGQPVPAVEAFDRLLASPAGLDAERLETAKQTRAEQATRIGEIELSVDVEGATVEVDNVEVGHTPLPGPLKVPSGSRLVSVSAKGHLPQRRQITVAGQAKVHEEMKLEAISGQPALIEITTKLVGADVLVDGQVVGHTPLGASLAIAPGQHEVEVRRPGYTSAKQSLNLGEGSHGTVALEPAVDAAALAREGGSLGLEISEPEAVVFVDGQPIGPYSKPLILPRGKHLVRIERADFFPFQREVEVPQGSGAKVTVELQPTPEKRDAYRSKTTTQRTWGWITVGAGAAITVTGLSLLFWRGGQEADAKDAFEAEVARNSPGGTCDPASAGQTDACRTALDLSLSHLEDARSYEKFMWIGAGVGVAVLGVGTALLLTNDDPARYEPKADSDVFGRVRVTPSGWADTRGGGFALLGSF